MGLPSGRSRSLILPAPANSTVEQVTKRAEQACAQTVKLGNALAPTFGLPQTATDGCRIESVRPATAEDFKVFLTDLRAYWNHGESGQVH